MQYYFIRHGQSQANLDHVFAGQSDSPLTTLGREQAHREGERLQRSGQTFDIIIASPLTRAYDTAVSIARALNYRVEDILIDPRLMERNLGSLQGQPIGDRTEAEIQAADGVESIENLAARCQDLLLDVYTTYIGKKVLFVSHAGVAKVVQVLAQMGDIDAIDRSQEVPNAQVFALSVDPSFVLAGR